MTDQLLAPQNGPLPPAIAGSLTAPFWDGCAEGVLRYQLCEHCGEALFPPAEHCRHCLSESLIWQAGTGHGEIYSYTIVYRPVTAAFRAPYAPAIVDLAEGYQMLTNIVGLRPDQLDVGIPVRVKFHQVSDDLWLPYFTGAGS